MADSRLPTAGIVTKSKSETMAPSNPGKIGMMSVDILQEDLSVSREGSAWRRFRGQDEIQAVHEARPPAPDRNRAPRLCRRATRARRAAGRWRRARRAPTDHADRRVH